MKDEMMSAQTSGESPLKEEDVQESMDVARFRSCRSWLETSASPFERGTWTSDGPLASGRLLDVTERPVHQSHACFAHRHVAGHWRIYYSPGQKE